MDIQRELISNLLFPVQWTQKHLPRPQTKLPPPPPPARPQSAFICRLAFVALSALSLNSSDRKYVLVHPILRMSQIGLSQACAFLQFLGFYKRSGGSVAGGEVHVAGCRPSGPPCICPCSPPRSARRSSSADGSRLVSIDRVCRFSRKHGEGFFRWIRGSYHHESHCKELSSSESLHRVIIIIIVVAKSYHHQSHHRQSHCKESSSSVIAKSYHHQSHCKELSSSESLHRVTIIAKSHHHQSHCT